MTTKLTLSIKKETVEKAKRISAQQGKSVSGVVQEYLDSLEDRPQSKGFAKIQQLLAPHRKRILASLPDDKSFKEIINDWRYEDYLRGTQPKPKTKRQAKQ